MNLAVNARDAMPSGGRLTISTAQVHLGESRAEALETAPGPHVRVSVSDDGIGMTQDVVARIFEPFYTTKGLGIGTGLGLAMVFGIVRQSGGAIYVDSEPGQGSTFHIVLPVVSETHASSEPALAPAGARGSETILLVEDDTGVRELAEANLRACGYDVLTAVDGRDALDVLHAQPTSIDILVTDVVMPNMSGPDLAAAVQAAYPDIRVLFISGYTDDAVVRQGLLQAEVAFLQKPYTPLGLAQKVRQVLDVAPPASV
jgi:CheY-like chemotaxis protein